MLFTLNLTSQEILTLPSAAKITKPLSVPGMPSVSIVKVSAGSPAIPQRSSRAMWTICDGRSCLVFSVQQDLCQDRKIMSQQISAQLLANTHWDGLKYSLFCV